MKKLLLIICILSACAVSIYAQQESKPQTDYNYKLNQHGDKFFNINIDFEIPFVKGINLGGAGMIGFSYFIFDSFAVGGEIAFSFMSTIGENMFYYVPITAKASYVLSAGRFEFPISLGLGFSFQAYTNRTYYGFVIKPEVGAYFRYSPEWAFGLTVGYTILPQTYNKSEYNRVGTILNAAASAKYYF